MTSLQLKQQALLQKYQKGSDFAYESIVVKTSTSPIFSSDQASEVELISRTLDPKITPYWLVGTPNFVPELDALFFFGSNRPGSNHLLEIGSIYVKTGIPDIQQAVGCQANYSNWGPCGLDAIQTRRVDNNLCQPAVTYQRRSCELAESKDEVAVFSRSYFSSKVTGPFRLGQDSDIPFAIDDDGDGKDEFGVYRSGSYFISDNEGQIRTGFFGQNGDKPVAGNFFGRKESIGVFRDGTFIFQVPTQAQANWISHPFYNGNLLSFSYGSPTAQFVVGDWDGDGLDSVAVFDGGSFYINYTLRPGTADLVVPFGSLGDVPVAGDWNGDGVDTIGVFREGTFYLTNSLVNPTQSIEEVQLGDASARPVTGNF